jgi:hypothetical protein
MKGFVCILLITHVFFATSLLAQQQDTTLRQDTSVQKAVKNTISHRDSIYLSKLSKGGSLMIAGGAGLCAAGAYLIWEGQLVYYSPVAATSATTTNTIAQNHQQGTAYIIAGGAAIAGGIILGAFGVKNIIEFKKRKKRLLLQSGLLESGNLGACLSW